MKATLLIITFLFFFFFSWSQATLFTPLNDSITGIPINLTYGGLYQSDYRAIDFDNDSDLDIYIGYNKILENLGNDSFALLTIQPSGNRFDWYDFDHDGDLDILASYIADSIIIYKNTLPDSVGFVVYSDTCYQVAEYI